ncbi:MAG: hypothetical protein IKF19_05950 [Bacilli bacterium]|nr:hypothetical protein [Bacilli bacterium]
MKKYIYKLYRFMYGRYGIDELYKFCLYFYILLFIISIFIKSKILTIIELLLLIIIIYRSMSRDISKRKKENKIYIDIKKKILKPFKNINRNIKDKEHIYIKCTKCKKILRLPIPNKRGLKHVKCPKCGKKITFFTLKEVKIEIIKKK